MNSLPPFHPLKNLQKHRDPLSLIKKTTAINTGWEAGKQGGRGGERGGCSKRALRSITEHACLSHILWFGFFHRCADAVHRKAVDLTPRSLTPLQMVQLSPPSSSLLTCRTQVNVLFTLELIKQNSSSQCTGLHRLLRDSIFNFYLVCEKVLVTGHYR